VDRLLDVLAIRLESRLVQRLKRAHEEWLSAALPLAREAARRRGWDLTEEQIRRSARELEVLARSDQACTDCQGLDHCQSPVGRGQVPVGMLRGGVVELSGLHHMCPLAARQAAQHRRHELLKASQYPVDSERMTLENFIPTPGTVDAFRAACELAGRDAGPGLVLAGTTGVGKTHLALAILRAQVERLVRRGELESDCVFACVPDLMDDLRAAVKVGRDRELLEHLRRARVLVLDDLGTERVTDWRAERLFLLLNGREFDRSITIVTTNYTDGALLAERFGPDENVGNRIVSRLIGMCRWVTLEGPDYRVDPEAVRQQAVFGEGTA